MANVTDEVLRYFLTGDPKFRKIVDTLRFSTTPQMDAREIIKLLTPVYDEAYASGFRDGYDQCNDGA